MPWEGHWYQSLGGGPSLCIEVLGGLSCRQGLGVSTVEGDLGALAVSRDLGGLGCDWDSGGQSHMLSLCPHRAVL